MESTLRDLAQDNQNIDSGYIQRVPAMQSEKTNEEILKLDTEMDIKYPL